MAEKYFLFQRDAVTEFSTVASNTGDGLSVVAIPASKLANVTAQPGEVIMRFDDAGIYDDVFLASTEGMPKARIDVPCEVGTEVALIEQILTFLTKEGGKSVMRFDAVTNTSTFSLVDFSRELVKSKLPNQPVLYSGAIASDPLDSGKIDPDSGASTTLYAGVHFPNPALRPTVDYNHEGLSGIADLAEVGQINTWDNAGTGGATYDLNSNTGTPFKQRAPSDNDGIIESSVEIDSGEALTLANQLTVTGAYTIYIAYSIDGVGDMHPIYGLNNDQCKGFGAGDVSDRMEFKHGGQSNSNLAFADIRGTDYNTKNGYIQDRLIDTATTHDLRKKLKPQTCYVWVIRRDADLNMYVHDYTGEVVGFVPRVWAGGADVDFATDGDLQISLLGGQGTGLEWSGNLARFGVVEDDVGTADAARIARELYDIYAYYPSE